MIEFLRGALDREAIAVDTETTTFQKNKKGKWVAKILGGRDYAMGASVSYMSDDGYCSMYFPIKHPSGNVPEVLPYLKWAIEQAKTVVFHHAKFDLPALETMGIFYTGKFYDTMLMAHLINENWPRSKRLDDLTRYYISEDVHKEMHPVLATWIEVFGWHSIPGNVMYSYATQDAHITLQLARKLFPLMLRELSNSEDLWEHKQEMVRLLIAMKRRGVRIDKAMCEAKVAEADREMARLVGELGFKPTPKKIGEVLVDQMKLPVLHWTKWNKTSKTPKHLFTPQPSFTSAALDDYEELIERLYPNSENKLVKNIIAYRGWQKSRSAFYQAWLDHMDDDGRVRPDYIMHKDMDDGGTVTGRLSCREPNLQQIPRVTNKDWNKDVKPCLIPADGYILVEADYSQLELRLAAAYADEKELKKVFNEGRDIFDEMSVRLGLTRDATKTFVYSTQYGAGNQRISNVFNISTSEAQEIRDNYYYQYPGFRRLSDEASYQVRQNKKIRIWSGRYRHFTKPDEENHKAMNACIQGGAADIVERIMVKCYKTFDNEEECRMLLQIHDALIFEIKVELLDKYLPLIKNTMESVNEIADFGVKFAVDVHKWATKDRLI